MRRRAMTRPGPALLALALGVHPALARAERTISLGGPFGEAPGAHRLTLPDESPVGRMPVVILLPDGPDSGNRADAVVDRLLARGIAVIEPHVEDGFPAPPEPADLAAALEDAAPGQLDPRRVGVLGFGAGGRAALLWPHRPVAALYPACAGAPIRVTATAALILHADDPAERAACARLPARAEAVPGATHAWDHRNGPDEVGVALLPHPDGGGARLLARRYPWAVEVAADRVADHFAAALLPVPEPGATALHPAAARGARAP